MKTALLIILFALLLVAFPQPAHAYYDDGTRVPQEVIAPLMAWVEAQTGIKVPMLPNVMASRSTLMRVISKMGRTSGRARALYVGGMVVLDHRSFDETDSAQISLLVHELVHYAQSFNHTRTWGCAQEKETQAYTLQNKWLQETGHAPFVTASWISRMASCPTETTTMAMAEVR